jgi:hypothetical protein
MGLGCCIGISNTVRQSFSQHFEHHHYLPDTKDQWALLIYNSPFGIGKWRKYNEEIRNGE